MRPLTDGCPKPLLPLGPEPLIGYQLRRLAQAGVRDVVVSTGYRAGQFVDVLGDGRRWGIQLRQCEEPEPLGTGGALRAAMDHMSDVDRVVAVNGDLLSSHDLAAQLASAASADVCMHVRQVSDVSQYGHVTCDGNGRVTRFAEKLGSGPGLANAGTYVISGDLLRSLPRGASSWERDLLPGLAGQGVVTAWVGGGYFRDVGDPTAYRLASVDAVTGVLPDTAPKEHGTSFISADADVSGAAVVGPGCSIQPGAVVESGAHLVDSVVLSGARVAAGARVERCVVEQGAVVGAGRLHRDTLVTAEPTDQ